MKKLSDSHKVTWLVMLQIPVSSLVFKTVYWTSCPNSSCNMKGKEGIMQSLDCEVYPEQRWEDPPQVIAALWPVLRALIPRPTQHRYRRSPVQVCCPRDPARSPWWTLQLCTGPHPCRRTWFKSWHAMGSSWRFHGPLFQPGQRASLFVFMRTELEEQKVFPMKVHLHHVKEHTGTMALNFSIDDYLFLFKKWKSSLRVSTGPQWLRITAAPPPRSFRHTHQCWLQTDLAILGTRPAAQEAIRFPKSRETASPKLTTHHAAQHSSPKTCLS